MSRTVKGGQSGACKGCEVCWPRMYQYTSNKAKARRKLKKEIKDEDSSKEG